MKKKFIKDAQREMALNAVYNRMRRGKSSMILAEYGHGKTSLLQMLRPRKKKLVWVESLGGVHHILAEILSQVAYECDPKAHLKMKHLSEIRKYCAGNAIVIIDECNDLQPVVWPYLKRIMDAGVPILLAGLPKVKYFLREKHGDILSRLKIIDLQSVGVDDFKKKFVIFEPEAIDVVYGESGGNMRRMEELIDDCIDKFEEINKGLETKMDRISIDIVAMFI